jgi:hypothetical protein
VGAEHLPYMALSLAPGEYTGGRMEAYARGVAGSANYIRASQRTAKQ